jgi:hypothetical protein
MYLLKRDLKYGKENEIKVLDTINKYFNDDIKLVKSSYCQYDFIGNNSTYELKTRRNAYSVYPTTIIPQSKIKDNSIFLFSFTDGLYYIKYTPEQFKDYEIKPYKRRDRGEIDKEQNYIFIPIEDLIKIN